MLRLPLLPARLTALAGLAVVVVALAGAAVAAELSFPRLTGRVVDAAHILDAGTVAALDAKLAAQEAKATDQVVVATVPSLQGTSVEDYANRLFRAWGIGQAKANNGVLLLVAPNERKVRIEVGYGLEGILTDAVASTIIRTQIVPAFKSGDMAAGIVKGTDAILEILNLDPEEARARAKALEQPSGWSEEEVDNLIFLVVMLVFWGFIIWRFTRGGGSGGGGGRRRRWRDAATGSSVSTWDWGSGSSGSSGGGWSGGGGSSGGGGASGDW